MRSDCFERSTYLTHVCISSEKLTDLDMLRLCILKLCLAMKGTGRSERLLSQIYFKNHNRFNDVICWGCRRGYAQRSSSLTPPIYTLHRLLDRISFDFPATLSTVTKEKYDEYGNKRSRKRYKHLGMLLGSLGFVVAFCDTSHFKGIHCD